MTPVLGGTAAPLPTAFVPLAFEAEGQAHVSDIAGIEGVVAHLTTARKNVALLLGPAGSGKTTLLGNYCRSLCDRLLDPPGEAPTPPAPFPLWLPCPRIEPTVTELPALRPFRDLALAEGEPFALLLDGLDEVRPDRQPEVVPALTDLLLQVEDRPEALALVTCRSEEVVRIQGVEPILSAFPTYSLRPPDPAARRQLFAQLAAREGEAAAQAAARIEGLLERYRHLGLGETPLLLTLFAFVVLHDHDLESVGSVRALFDLAFAALAKRRIGADRLPFARDVLQHLAAGLYRRDPPGLGRIDVTLAENELFDLVLDYGNLHRGVGLPSVEDLLLLVRKSGVLVGEAERLAFVHRSFFEYFLALELAHAVSSGDYDLFSGQPLSQNVLSFLASFPLDRPLVAVLDSTRGRSFEEVRYRGGNAINLLRRSGTEPRDLDLTDAVLAGADLRRADLAGIDFGTADLRGADFSYASLAGADWSRVTRVSHPIQIEEGREIRCAVHAPQLDLVAVGSTLGDLLLLHGQDLKLHSRRAGCHEHTVTILSLAEPDGWLVSAGYDERCHLWSLPGLERLASVPQRLPKCRALATYAPRRGTCYLVCGTTLDSLLLYKVLGPADPAGPRPTVHLVQEVLQLPGSPFRSLQWSADGALVLVGGFDGAVHWLRFDPERGRLAKIATPKAESAATVWGTAIAPDGRRAAALDDDGRLHLWEIEKLEPRAEGPLAVPGLQHGRCLCLSADGSAVYCGDDAGNVLALGASGGRWAPRWSRRAHGDSVYGLRLLHAGRDLLTCGLDAKVSLLDAATGLDRTPPYVGELPAQKLSVAGLKVRQDLLDEDDRRYLSRRGALLVPPPAPGPPAGTSFDYDVVLSYAGEDRVHAEALASRLKQRRYRVFYDQDHIADLWGKNLREELQEIYSRKARFCVVFASRHYLAKPWTRAELEAVEEREMQDRGPGYLLVIDLDGSRLPGISAVRGYVSIDKGIDAIAALLDQKLQASPG